MSFADLKRNRQAQINKLVDEAQKVSSNKKSYDDDRYWKLSRDKAGNGHATLRFLPAPDNGVPWIQYWDHGFKGPKGWYIEKSLTSIGQNDPVSEMNSVLWDTNIEANRELARKRKRRLHYVSNVLVVDDPVNPDNNGKIFLFEYGKTIFDMLTEAMQPAFDDIAPLNPFDMWEGANFKLRAREVDGWVKYDKSEFSKPKAIGTDEEMEALFEKVHDIRELLDPKNFKTYDELAQKLQQVLGEDQTQGRGTLGNDEPTAPAPEPDTPVTEPALDADDDEDMKGFFAGLADEDDAPF